MLMGSTVAKLTAAAVAIVTTSLLAFGQQRSSNAQQNARAAGQQVAPLRIPQSIQAEHEEIQDELLAATMKSNRVGKAARAVAALLEPHFNREEQIALPPLGMLEPLASGVAIGDTRVVLPMVDSLRVDLPHMLREHKAITAAVSNLERAAIDARDTRVLALADQLKLHARNEEEVLYPAAILVGEIVRSRQRPLYAR